MPIMPHGSAGWAEAPTIRKGRGLFGRNNGIPLGYWSEQLEGLAPSLRYPVRYTGDRQMVLVGPNGSGKSMRILLPSLYELKDYSICVIDIKGELCAMSSEHRRSLGSHIIKLNPFNVLGLGSDNFNPIAGLDLDDDFPDNALELSEAIISVDNTREAHWPQAAQELVAGLIMFVRLVIPNGSFRDVRALLGQNDEGIRTMVLSPGAVVDGVEHFFRYKGLKLPGIIETAARTGWEEMATKTARFGDINPENRELHSVLSTALVQTRWLDSRPIGRDLASNPIDFSIMKQRPTTVYLMLPARRLGTHAAWLRLCVTSVIQKLMKDVRTNCPVLLMLDEMFAVAYPDGLPAVQRNMAMFRGFSVKLLSVFQDLAQAETLYGPAFESFLGNAGIIQAFAPNDITTSDFVSRMSGQTTIYFTSESESLNPNPMMPRGIQSSFTSASNYIAMPLIMPHETRGIGEGYSIIFSNEWKGALRCFTPWPGDVPALRRIMSLAP
jgi:type IV secretion system protein VirD4